MSKRKQTFSLTGLLPALICALAVGVLLSVAQPSSALDGETVYNEICMQRIKDRGRHEETGIPLEYLKDLEELHDEWLLDNPKAIVLDGQNHWSAEAVSDQILAAV